MNNDRKWDVSIIKRSYNIIYYELFWLSRTELWYSHWLWQWTYYSIPFIKPYLRRWIGIAEFSHQNWRVWHRNIEWTVSQVRKFCRILYSWLLTTCNEFQLFLGANSIIYSKHQFFSPHFTQILNIDRGFTWTGFRYVWWRRSFDNNSRTWRRRFKSLWEWIYIKSFKSKAETTQKARREVCGLIRRDESELEVDRAMFWRRLNRPLLSHLILYCVTSGHRRMTISDGIYTMSWISSWGDNSHIWCVKSAIVSHTFLAKTRSAQYATSLSVHLFRL